jgi:hypothetical protein
MAQVIWLILMSGIQEKGTLCERRLEWSQIKNLDSALEVHKGRVSGLSAVGDYKACIPNSIQFQFLAEQLSILYSCLDVNVIMAPFYSHDKS